MGVKSRWALKRGGALIQDFTVFLDFSKFCFSFDSNIGWWGKWPNYNFSFFLQETKSLQYICQYQTTNPSFKSLLHARIPQPGFLSWVTKRHQAAVQQSRRHRATEKWHCWRKIQGLWQWWRRWLSCKARYKLRFSLNLARDMKQMSIVSQFFDIPNPKGSDLTLDHFLHHNNLKKNNIVLLRYHYW